MKHPVTCGSKIISVFLLSALIVLNSCTKEKVENHKKEINEKENLVIPVPVAQKGAKKNKHKSIRELIKASDKTKLEKFKRKITGGLNARPANGSVYIPGDPLLEQEAAEILKPMNAEILLYLTQTYPQFGPTNMVNINDPDFTYFAQVYSVAEQSGFIKNPNYLPIAYREIPTWLRCTTDVLLGYFDVTTLIRGLGTFEFSTVWTAVKFAVKKYVGWVAAAILIYDITTQCI